MTKDDEEEIAVRLASTHEMRSAGLAYIEQCYSKRYGIRIGPPEHLFIALRDQQVIGTFGMNTSRGTYGLRLPERYRFDPCALGYAMPEETSLEFVRWISESRTVSARLMEAGARFALRNGMVRAWCEQTPPVHRACRRYGIQFNYVSRTLSKASIEYAYAQYYAAEQPALYTCELNQVRSAARAFLDREYPRIR